MTSDQVKKSENATFIYSTDIALGYDAKIFDKNCKLLFGFENDRLKHVMYSFTIESKKEAEQLYTKFISDIDKKYAEFSEGNEMSFNNKIMKLYRTPRTHIIATNSYIDDKKIVITFSEINAYDLAIQKLKNRDKEKYIATDPF